MTSKPNTIDRVGPTTLRIPCKNTECDKFIDVYVKSITSFPFRETLYACGRDCLEISLKSAGYIIRKIPTTDEDKEKSIDDDSYLKIQKILNERLGQINFFIEEAKTRPESMNFKRRDREFLLNSLGSKAIAYDEMKKILGDLKRIKGETNKKEEVPK